MPTRFVEDPRVLAVMSHKYYNVSWMVAEKINGYSWTFMVIRV